MKHASLTFAGLCLTGSVLGCTDNRFGAPVEQERSWIVSGVQSVPSDDAVVALQGDYTCSGTLLAPDVVLTALHCVSQFDLQQQFTCKPDGSLAAGSSGGTLGPLVDPGTISINTGVMSSSSGIHGKKIYGTNSPVVCRDDIAVVVLDGNVSVDVPPVRVRFDRSTKDGEAVRVVGYGETEVDTEVGRRERDDLSILGVGSPNSVIAGDPGVAPRTVMIGEGPCHGDSGGPLFAVETGAEIGVYSLLSTNRCSGADVKNFYTQIAPYEDMIRMVLSSVGEEPLVEVVPETGAGGEGGMTGQAGEPGTAGTPEEAGAPGVTGGSGGGTGVGGSGGSGAVGGSTPSGTGGGAATGDDTPSGAGADNSDSTGSGSRRDPSCTCRTSRTGNATPWSWVGFSFAALSCLRRRRR